LIWAKKIGCYQFIKPIEKSNDWILIIDESIQFGHEKLLVIYGIKASEIDFKRALTYNDLTPLTIASKCSWTSDLIKKEIEKIEEKTGKILYVVADGGNAICKSLKMSNIIHIYDITHKIAWILKTIYKDNPFFIEYTKKMAKMRTALVLSNIAHILPPNQRVNSRFMNLDILSDWGSKVLSYLEKNNTETREYQQLKWVEAYRELIEELTQVNNTINQIKTKLKINGLSIKTMNDSKQIINNLKTENIRTEYIKTELINYMKTTIMNLPKEKKILCTSDIIESSFGKYKNYISDNPMTGITNLALCLSSFTSDLNVNEIKNALENVKMKDLKIWTEENIGQTNMSKRRDIFRKAG
jgi:hypothetical protein